MRIKSLQVINGEFFSGAERVQDLLALYLPDADVETAFVCIKPDRFPERRQSAVPLHVLPMSSRFDLAPVRQIARIAREGGYHLIHTHSPRAAMLGALASIAARLPLVHHVHSPTSRDTEHALRNRINSMTENLSMRRARALIPVSDSLRRHLRQNGYAESKVFCVPNGVPTLGDLVQRRAPEGRWVIGCMALFRPRKGAETLLKALAGARAAGCDVTLLAVGPFETPEYERETRALAEGLGIATAIEWTGFTADVNAEFRRMDAFVLPSLYGEGMPMVVLEAMAAGVPVIASDVEGIPEVIEDGTSGLIVVPGDPVSLTQAICKLVSGDYDWQAMRERAHERQAARFSARSMADAVAHVYREVLSRG